MTFTHQVGDGIQSAIIKATKPVDATPAVAASGRTTLPLASDPSCC